MTGQRKASIHDTVSALRWQANQLLKIADELEQSEIADKRVRVSRLLIDNQVPRSEVVKILQQRLGVSERTAYRAWQEANDMRASEATA